MRSTYNRELEKILRATSPPPATPMTREQLEAAIAEITAALTGPMHNAMRLNLVEDRQMLRKQLAAVQPA